MLHFAIILFHQLELEPELECRHWCVALVQHTSRETSDATWMNSSDSVKGSWPNTTGGGIHVT